MPIDFKALSEENLRRYGTDVGLWAPGLLANLYHERIHFVFELLQNAEDAIRKRVADGPNSVRFHLSRAGLTVTHYGKPFDESDVRGLCGISQSTKRDELTAIGRFGIGFKSVYAVTNEPQISSGGHHFAVENYVHPVELPPTTLESSCTRFWLPFRDGDGSIYDEIAEGLQSLDSRTLLFLKYIDAVNWEIEDGETGNYVRHAEDMQPGVKIVTLASSASIGRESATERWLVFANKVEFEGNAVGFVEVGYALNSAGAERDLSIKYASNSRIVASFPTGVSTNLGVLLQGPYRTTPARDNVPPKDDWNQHLVHETARLLVASLGILRDLNALSVDVLGCLPIDKKTFGPGSMFEPLYLQVADAIRSQQLLPSYRSGWVASTQAALAGTRGIADLLDANQLMTVLELPNCIEWLNPSITVDRSPKLRTYLIEEHAVQELQPQYLLSKFTKEFLEAQTDEWIQRLYAFLNGHPQLFKQTTIANKPWVRLEGGTHVTAFIGRQPNAFLPTGSPSGFPTVRAALCTSETALNFLKETLNLTVPDPVDDVIANILPYYSANDSQEHDLAIFEEHLKAIAVAYKTDSRTQRERLVAALSEANWVPADCYDSDRHWLKPAECYWPTQRLKALFDGITGIPFVDLSITGLKDDSVRTIMVSSGVASSLRLVQHTPRLSDEYKRELRKQTGNSGLTGNEQVDDRTLLGLNAILAGINTDPQDLACARGQLLWQALGDVISARGENILQATYSWAFYSGRQVKFPAKFIRLLKETKWIPSSSGSLVKPKDTEFEEIEPNWSPNAALQSALKFLPAAANLLAKEFGLDSDLLRMLKTNGITSIVELKQRTGLSLAASPAVATIAPGTVAGGHKPAEPGVSHLTNNVPATSLAANTIENKLATAQGSEVQGSPYTAGKVVSNYSGVTNNPRHTGSGAREFVSYIAVHPVADDEHTQGDADVQAARMEIEEHAITHILNLEPTLKRTAAGNPGFDLFGVDEAGNYNRWIEVKAMTGSLDDHPVAISRKQFEMAQDKGTCFWLYIVEAATSTSPRIVKIQNPAGVVRSYTFDRGWREYAITSIVDTNTGEVIV